MHGLVERRFVVHPRWRNARYGQEESLVQSGESGGSGSESAWSYTCRAAACYIENMCHFVICFGSRSLLRNAQTRGREGVSSAVAEELHYRACQAAMNLRRLNDLDVGEVLHRGGYRCKACDNEVPLALLWNTGDAVCTSAAQPIAAAAASRGVHQATAAPRTIPFRYPTPRSAALQQDEPPQHRPRKIPRRIHGSVAGLPMPVTSELEHEVHVKTPKEEKEPEEPKAKTQVAPVDDFLCPDCNDPRCGGCMLPPDWSWKAMAPEVQIDANFELKAETKAEADNMSADVYSAHSL